MGSKNKELKAYDYHITWKSEREIGVTTEYIVYYTCVLLHWSFQCQSLHLHNFMFFSKTFKNVQKKNKK